jgi:hypothetical protein
MRHAQELHDLQIRSNDVPEPAPDDELVFHSPPELDGDPFFFDAVDRWPYTDSFP